MQIGDITQSFVSLTKVIQSLAVSPLRCRTQESTCRPPPPPVPALHPAILCVLILAAAPEGPGAATHLRPQVTVTLGVDGVTQLILNHL